MASLEAHELDALRDAMAKARAASAGGDVVALPHDLTNPERNIPRPMPALDDALASFASGVGHALTGRTRRPLIVSPGRVTPMRVGEVLPLLMPPTVTAVLRLRPTAHEGLVLVDGALADALLSASLGSPVRSDEAPVAFTHIERHLLRKLVSLTTGTLGDALAPIVSVRAEAHRIESDPRLALALDKDEILLLASFAVHGDIEGTFQLALPFALLEPGRARLSTRPRPASDEAASFRSALERRMCAVPVEVRAELGRAQLSVEEASSMRAGDVLVLDGGEQDLLRVFVGERLKLLARPTVLDGRIAVVVEGAAASGLGGDMTEHLMEEERKRPRAAAGGGIDLGDVPVDVAVELGRTRAPLERVLSLEPGALLRLDKGAGEPLDVLINGRAVARGEAVVVGDRFAVRITELLGEHAGSDEGGAP